MKIKIRHDVYNISKRIKKIDKNYYIVYDTSRACFEVHYKGQVGGSYCLSLPYPELDARTLFLINKTKSKNITFLLEEIEENNKNIINKQNLKVKQQFNLSIENLLKRR